MTVLVQLVFTAGLALILSALTVHFRDIRDMLANILTLWFFATPIIYSWRQDNVQRYKTLFNLNPFTHLAISYQEILFFGPVGHWKWLLALGAVSIARVSRRLLAVRSAARLVRGGRVTSGPERDRAGQRLEDLPPLRRPAVRDAEERAAAAQHPARSAAERDVSRAHRRHLSGAEGLDLRRHRPERIGQEHRAEAGRRHHQADRAAP